MSPKHSHMFKILLYFSEVCMYLCMYDIISRTSRTQCWQRRFPCAVVCVCMHTCVCIFVYVCIPMCAYVCVYTCVYAKKPEDIRCPSLSLCLIPLRQSLSVNLELRGQPNSHDYSHTGTHTARAGIIGMCVAMSVFLHWRWGHKFRSSSCAADTPIHWASSPDPNCALFVNKMLEHRRLPPRGSKQSWDLKIGP